MTATFAEDLNFKFTQGSRITFAPKNSIVFAKQFTANKTNAREILNEFFPDRIEKHVSDPDPVETVKELFKCPVGHYIIKLMNGDFKTISQEYFNRKYAQISVY
jgi:hypothetical protein